MLSLDFQLGHIFNSLELPKNKQHLDGALYFADAPDGSMHIVSREMPRLKKDDPLGIDMGRWKDINAKIAEINLKGNNIRIGKVDDWDSFLKSEFKEKAKLQIICNDELGAYWVNKKWTTQPSNTLVYHPFMDHFATTLKDDSYHHLGRFFCNEPKLIAMR